MPRTIWKGAISFGLVHVPVQLYPATRATKPGFHLLDKRSMDPIGYRQINKRTGKEVKREDIVRGFEYEKEKYVVLSDSEIKSANPKSTQTIDVLAFVEAYAVNFLYLDTPYYLSPDRRGGKVYAMFRDALRESGRLAIALVVMHDRQHLCALVPSGDAIAMNTLRWADEVLSSDDLGLPPSDAKSSGVTAKELEMARRLIDDMSEDWTPDAYRDTFSQDIMALVDKKIASGQTQEVEEVDAPKERTSADVVDLSELLRRSLGKKQQGERKTVNQR